MYKQIQKLTKVKAQVIGNGLEMGQTEFLTTFITCDMIMQKKIPLVFVESLMYVYIFLGLLMMFTFFKVQLTGPSRTFNKMWYLTYNASFESQFICDLMLSKSNFYSLTIVMLD